MTLCCGPRCRPQHCHAMGLSSGCAQGPTTIAATTTACGSKLHMHRHAEQHVSTTGAVLGGMQQSQHRTSGPACRFWCCVRGGVKVGGCAPHRADAAPSMLASRASEMHHRGSAWLRSTLRGVLSDTITGAWATARTAGIMTPSVHDVVALRVAGGRSVRGAPQHVGAEARAASPEVQP